MINKLPHLIDDGLLTPEVRAYSERKYALISYYADMFTSSMKGKWSLIYIDLFAGTGRGKIKDVILPASPLLALGVKNKFHKYVFCEADAEKMETLQIRVKRDYPDQKVSFIEGDANVNVDKILKEVKDPELGNKYLSFCLVDPYNFRDFDFDTIRNLSKIFVDFLVLIPTFMDAHRNLTNYFKENNIKIEKFTGEKNWRGDWLEAEKKGARFGPYLADLFGRSMKKLNFIYKDTSEMVLVLNDKNSPVYHLAFFSRNPLGIDFCGSKVNRYTNGFILMPAKSAIEWTESTWNPVTGCTKVSPGCAHCYAERMAKRLKAMGQANYINGFKVTIHPEVLEYPNKTKKPMTIFVNSMSDLFHKDIPLKFIEKIFGVMLRTPQHTYQALTKRSERLVELSGGLYWPDNIWMGVTVENADYQYRIDDLRKCGAKLKFLSLEPLLGPMPKLNLDGIDWVIVGGESGPGARPMKEEWVVEIKNQCIKQNVPFFFKQWGGINKKRAGRLLEGRTWDEMPRTDLVEAYA